MVGKGGKRRGEGLGGKNGGWGVKGLKRRWKRQVKKMEELIVAQTKIAPGSVSYLQ